MESQKILELSEKIVVIADYREKEIIEKLKSLNVCVVEKSLDIGDFIISDKRIAIERKTHSDFVSSIIDGRIFEQARDLGNNFEKSIIIIEGYSDRQINCNALKGAISSLLIDFNISLINTKNPIDTATLIYWLANREQKTNKYPIAFKIGKKSKEMKILQECILSSIPGISTILAKRLLEKFETVENVFIANEKELNRVKGIGKKLAGKIRKILTIKYE